MFRRKTRVILDTNTLMLLGKSIDIFAHLDQALQEPYTIYAPRAVLEELQSLAQGKSKESFDAKLGYVIAKQKALKTLSSSSNKHADDVIVNKTTSKDIVVTQDKELAKRLQEQGVRVLRYQQHKFIFQGGASCTTK